MKKSVEKMIKKENKRQMISKEIKFIDLFCGIGGFHNAFQGLGKCVYACDIDKKCR